MWVICVTDRTTVVTTVMNLHARHRVVYLVNTSIAPTTDALITVQCAMVSILVEMAATKLTA